MLHSLIALPQRYPVGEIRRTYIARFASLSLDKPTKFQARGSGLQDQSTRGPDHKGQPTVGGAGLRVLLLFCCSASVATVQASLTANATCDRTKVSGHVAKICLHFHSVIESPSGLFPSVCRIPEGSRWDGAFAEAKAHCNSMLMAEWHGWRPWLLLQPCSTNSSITPPQCWQLCGWHRVWVPAAVQPPLT